MTTASLSMFPRLALYASDQRMQLRLLTLCSSAHFVGGSPAIRTNLHHYLPLNPPSRAAMVLYRFQPMGSSWGLHLAGRKLGAVLKSAYRLFGCPATRRTGSMADRRSRASPSKQCWLGSTRPEAVSGNQILHRLHQFENYKRRSPASMCFSSSAVVTIQPESVVSTFRFFCRAKTSLLNMSNNQYDQQQQQDQQDYAWV